VLPSGLYFDTSTIDHYAVLATMDHTGIEAGARVEPAAGKRHPTDFALWRTYPADEPARAMEWDSPWGRGAPGWHLECSVMSMRLLGEHFDVHTGGIDHIPVHHTNEIAQSEAYLGGPWVPYWLHGEFINLREAKMSKSKGGTLLLSDLEQQGFHPLTYRFFLVGSHYRNQTDFTWRGLEGARIAQRRLLERLRERGAPGGEPLRYEDAAAQLPASSPARAYLERLDDAVSNDLNTAQALAALSDLSRDEGVRSDDVAIVLGAFESVLAIGLLDLAPDKLEPPARELALGADEVDELLREREDARRRRDFASADEIRNLLDRFGIEVRDTADGPVWKPRPAVLHRDDGLDR
jgi:cysteinyl-tRNA synthetase